MKCNLLVTLLLFLGCQSEPSTLLTIQNNLESYFKPTLPVPHSYEFVAITELDTFTHKKYAERIIELQKINLTNVTDRLTMMDQAEAEAKKALSANPGDTTALRNILEIDYSRKELKKQQHEVDSLTAVLSAANADAIKFIQLQCTFKADNPQGQKVLHQYYIKLNEDLSVQHASEL